MLTDTGRNNPSYKYHIYLISSTKYHHSVSQSGRPSPTSPLPHLYGLSFSEELGQLEVDLGASLVIETTHLRPLQTFVQRHCGTEEETAGLGRYRYTHGRSRL